MNGLNHDELGYYTRPRSLTKVHFQNPRRCEILLSDVAYHLARSCRFNNAIEPHYSVAEHSILMAQYFLTIDLTKEEYNDRENLACQALMHDANEYLFGDIPATIKKLLPDYKLWEEPFERFVLNHFGLDGKLDPRVKKLDRQMCSTEQLILRGHEPDTYVEEGTLEHHIIFQLWDWQTAQSEYLMLFHMLFPDYQDVTE